VRNSASAVDHVVPWASSVAAAEGVFDQAVDEFVGSLGLGDGEQRRDGDAGRDEGQAAHGEGGGVVGLRGFAHGWKCIMKVGGASVKREFFLVFGQMLFFGLGAMLVGSALVPRTWDQSLVNACATTLFAAATLCGVLARRCRR
jgi:hypothetical protein